jgi:sialidase-1
MLSRVVLAIILCATAAHAAELVDVYTKGVEGYPDIRIPALVVTNAGTLLAFAEGRQAGDHSENDIILKRSTDGGATWGSLQVIAEMGGDSLNDPCAVVLPDSGRILLMYQRFPQGYHTGKLRHTEQAALGFDGPTNTQTFLVHSDDDGVTWSEPRDISRMVRRDDVIAVGSPGSGIVLRHAPHAGRVLIPIYEHMPAGGGATAWRNCVAISDDHGETWRLSERPAHEGMAGYGNECQLAEFADGSIRLDSRNQGGVPMRKFTTSTDGGETWAPMQLDAGLVSPACMASILLVPRKEADDLLVVSLPNTETKREMGTLLISTDQGKTWPRKHVLYPGEFAYSCLALLPNGDVACLFERDHYGKISLAVIPVKTLAP